MAEQDYKPGENAPATGVYLVKHNGHREEHQATLFQNEQFPSCAKCNANVRYRLVRAAAAIRDDDDFRR